VDEDPQRAVGNADHLVDDRCRADLVQVVPVGRLRLLVAHGDEREQAVAADDVVDQAHRAFLTDGERCHRLREDDRLLQRQHGQRRGQLVSELLSIPLLFSSDDDLILGLAHASRPSSGSVTRRRPRS
jgi:hypothetical protein